MRYRILSGVITPRKPSRKHGSAQIYFHPFSIKGDIDAEQTLINQAIGDNAPFISRPVAQVSVHQLQFVDSDSDRLFSRDRSELEAWELHDQVDFHGRYLKIDWKTKGSTEIQRLSWMVMGEIGEPSKPASHYRTGSFSHKGQESKTYFLPKTRRDKMTEEKQSPAQQEPAKDPGCGLSKYQHYDADNNCPTVGKLADCVLETRCDKTFTIASNKKCPECGDADVPNLDPCFSVSWGDGKHDSIETNDTETFCITAWNPYTNVIFRNVMIQFAVVDPNDKLPNGEQAITIVPDRDICFGDLPACEIKGGDTRITREVTLTSCAAREGHYNIFIGACFSVEIPDQGTVQCFPIKLSAS